MAGAGPPAKFAIVAGRMTGGDPDVKRNEGQVELGQSSIDQGILHIIASWPSPMLSNKR